MTPLSGKIQGKFQKEFSEIYFSAGKKLTPRLMSYLDSAVDWFVKDRGFKLTCKKGCSHCCYILTLTTKKEVDYIKKFLKKNPKISRKKRDIPDKFKFERFEATGENLADEYVVKVSPRTRRCRFLNDDNSCSIYDVRPIMCRVYLAVTPPKNCDTVKNNGEIVSTVDTRWIEMNAMNTLVNSDIENYLYLHEADFT